MYRICSLFAGVGGLSYGFASDSDFEIVAANEILPNMAKAYTLNHPSVRMYNCDIRDFSLENLQNDLGIKKGDIDIVVGGPPCQAYSTIGKRRKDDPRGQLFKEYARVLNEFRPSVFVFENVKGLLSMNGGDLIKEIISQFEKLGYNMNLKLLNAADFGTPQIRERVIIVGTLCGEPFEYPKQTHYNPEEENIDKEGRKPYVTLGEAIGDLPSIKNGESSQSYACNPQNDYQRIMRGNSHVLADHQTSRSNDKLVRLMKALPDGGTPEDLPENLRPNSGFKNTYCRLWWNKPSTTITRNLGCPSSSRCIHPKDPRPLTTREGARLQGFPDNYKFYGSKSDKNLQIGNAVPTFLSMSIKNAVKEYLKKHPVSDM